MLQVERLLKALDGRAEVAKFDVNFGFFDEDLGYGLVVEENFVELDKSFFEVLVFEGFLGQPQLFQYFVFFDLGEVPPRFLQPSISHTK